MKTKMLGVLASAGLVACGGGGGSAAPASAPQNVTTPPVTSPAPPATTAADLALAARLYKGDERTPAGFAVETRPASVTGTLATRHLKNTDFATGPQAAAASYEVCTNDMAQAIDWSESVATWAGQYSDLVEVHADARLFEIVRVPRADNTAMLRHRVFKCEYLDRSDSDLRADTGAAGDLNQRPLTAAELQSLAEYLWQFTLFNNSDYAVETSTSSANGSQLVHTLRLGQLVRGVNGACDTVQLSDWAHTLNPTDGSLSRSLTNVRSYQVKDSGGTAQACSN